jgi:hypothetical protein
MQPDPRLDDPQVLRFAQPGPASPHALQPFYGALGEPLRLQQAQLLTRAGEAVTASAAWMPLVIRELVDGAFGRLRYRFPLCPGLLEAAPTRGSVIASSTSSAARSPERTAPSM